MKHPVTKIRKRRKREVVDAFGSKCSVCGYDKCLDAMHFHHTDPLIKENNPTKIINQWNTKRSIEQLQKEKVVLLCANCHAEAHSEEYDYQLDKLLNPIIETECKSCHTLFHQIDSPTKRKQKYCSDECAKVGIRKVKDRPSKEELIELLEKFSYVRVGKMFGVSDNAIRKWLK
jgi:hypothetical protein